MPIIIIIDKHKYDVTLYIHKHPGEGIRGVELRQMNNKDMSYEFDRFHYSDEPFEILEKVRKLGEYECIKYLGVFRLNRYIYFYIM